jgi:2-haloacid dehalogenase
MAYSLAGVTAAAMIKDGRAETPSGNAMLDPASIKALIFDVFGTVVDWRTSIARESEAILKPEGYTLDWLAFADAWRDEYQPAMEEVRTGKIPFSKLDVLHRRNLERILPRFKVSSLDEATMQHLNKAWHRLDGWPDATEGLTRLHKKYLIAPCSNGNISLMCGIARRNNFPWDAILGAEIAGDYKPKPVVYLKSADAFDCKPHECVMVAAHSGDLASAAACGLKTAHVARPNEHGPGKGEPKPTVPVDIAVSSFIELADKLDA